MSQPFKAYEHETKLEQFSDCFKDEKDLRLALIALLERLPNTSRVRHLHGTSERGKDIVFTSGGAFATEEIVACVIKNSPITGSVQSDTGARTVYLQAEQCLDTPFLSSKGEEEYVNRVFVITPYECTQIAIESIKGKLEKPEAAVKFLYGRELYDLFDKYYPEYLVFRSGLFGSYITDLESGISKDAAVTNLLMKHGLSGNNHEISRIYVQPMLEITIAKQFLMTEWPDLGSLPKLIFESDIQSFASRAITFGRFLAILVPNEMAGDVRTVMDQFALSVRSAWKSAFENYRRTHALLGMSESGERKRTPLPVPALAQLTEGLRQQTFPMRQIFDDFLEKLLRANQLAETKPETLAEFLAHPNRHDYSYVRGVSAQMPAAFEESIVVATVIRTTSQAPISSGENLLLTAPAGFGKSSFCRWNVLRDLKNLKDGSSNVVPVMIPLHQLDGELSTGASALFENHGTLRELWAARRSADGNKVFRRFRLYFDGLDEVPDANRQLQLCGLAQQLKLEAVLTFRQMQRGVLRA